MLLKGGQLRLNGKSLLKNFATSMITEKARNLHFVPLDCIYETFLQQHIATGNSLTSINPKERIKIPRNFCRQFLCSLLQLRGIREKIIRLTREQEARRGPPKRWWNAKTQPILVHIPFRRRIFGGISIQLTKYFLAISSSQSKLKRFFFRPSVNPEKKQEFAQRIRSQISSGS